MRLVAVIVAAVTALFGGIGGPAASSVPAERVTPPLTVAWIGGSEVELRDVSLTGAMADHLPAVGDRPIAYRPYTSIAAMPEDDVAHVDAAVAAGADVLAVSVNPAWLTWEDPYCAAVPGQPVDPVERYVCVLSPISDEITARRHAALTALVDRIVATGLPAYLYFMPHSTTALTDPRIADLIAAREAELAAFDPGVARVRFRPASFTRGLDGFAQPDHFVDMVHLTPGGAQAVAAWLAGDLAGFLATVDVG